MCGQWDLGKNSDFAQKCATGLHRKPKFVSFRETGHETVCNRCATHPVSRRFQTDPTCNKSLRKVLIDKGFSSILSKEKTGLENPVFWCE